MRDAAYHSFPGPHAYAWLYCRYLRVKVRVRNDADISGLIRVRDILRHTKGTGIVVGMPVTWAIRLAESVPCACAWGPVARASLGASRSV